MVRLGLGLVYGWLVVTHGYLYNFPMSLSLSLTSHALQKFGKRTEKMS